MLRDKINAIISEVNSQLAEREELVYTIALALLTRKNLFVLGDPGQAKSQAIDSFRSHIRDARQFEILMSKGIAKRLKPKVDYCRCTKHLLKP